MSKESAWRREGYEPSEAHHGVPWVLALLVVAVAAWGGWTMSRDVGFGELGHGDQRSYEGLTAGSSVAAAAGDEVDGAAIFQANCMACHQQSGQGVPGVFPPLAGSEWVQGAPERPVAIVLHGLQGPIEVAGTAYASMMPPQPLNDAQIAAVLTHVRGSFGNAASPVDAALVAKVRAATSDQSGPIAGAEALVSRFP